MKSAFAIHSFVRLARAMMSLLKALPLKSRPCLQGYVDARSVRHVAGWVRQVDRPGRKIAVQVVLPNGEVLAKAVANRFNANLASRDGGDGRHSFYAAFSRILTETERDQVEVRPTGSKRCLELAPAVVTYWSPISDDGSVQGYVDERSNHHIAGWARHIADDARTIELELVVPGAPLPRPRLRANQFSQHLVNIGVGDGRHAFQHFFLPPLTDAERDALEVRVVANQAVLPLAPQLITHWHPIDHLAMDIVNNCNLRCPFCVVDYAATRDTHFMADETFDKALRLLPFVIDGNFWLSCLHEATLHPRLLNFIARIPQELRKKVFYTTNLAKRMPDGYFKALCDSGLHHLNISIESLDPAIYEKMRAGARFPIFLENWQKLLSHHASGTAPPKLRYNVMCYRSNLTEIPSLVRHLLDERKAWQVELRHTYDVAHIPAAFRAEEFLTTAEWAWLKQALSGHDPARVLLLMPPGERGFDHDSEVPSLGPPGDDDGFRPWLGEGEPYANRAARPFKLMMNWEGTLKVYGPKPMGPDRREGMVVYAKTNIHFIPDPLAFLLTL